jgi:hypothetical protein
MGPRAGRVLCPAIKNPGAIDDINCRQVYHKGIPCAAPLRDVPGGGCFTADPGSGSAVRVTAAETGRIQDAVAARFATYKQSFS